VRFILVLFGFGVICTVSGASPPTSNRIDFAAIQEALDNEGFSPGLIDGLKGPRTDEALAVAREAGRAIHAPDSPWTAWPLPAGYSADIAPVPESWVERSKLKSMGYSRLREKIAEQFHVSEAFLRILNPAVRDWTTLGEGTPLKVPSLNPVATTRAEYLEISLSRKVIVARDTNGRAMASFPCSIAAKEEKRPLGWLTITKLALNPDYLFDPAIFPEIPETATMTSKLMIPPGPRNPVGAVWMSLEPTSRGKALSGTGIHGTPHPEDIGKTESHGCFRLTNWDAQRLARLVRINTPVLVTKDR
jgi:lipoprotein-anchoring transpeptidase ErfK/SrfK